MDSELSASELRKRYMRGGTLNDDELTSAQLRARHAIPSNSKGRRHDIVYLNDQFLVVTIVL